MSEPPAIDPSEFAALIRDATDEQLQQGLEANRDVILEEIFRRMPESFSAERARHLDAVVEWQIADRPDGGVDRFQLAIRGGSCIVQRDGDQAPDVTYTIGAVDFVKLVSGNESGPKLFIFGRLKIRGDLLLAARMPLFFEIPTAAVD